MRGMAVALVVGLNYFIGAYYGLVNLTYTALLTVSLFVVLRHIRRIRYSPFRDFISSSETPPVTILIPAYNEERVILQSVRSALSVNYPYVEVIVINDGSTDSTLDRLIQAYGLRRIDRAYRSVLKTAEVRGFYYHPDAPNLLVVDKVNSGKADSLNCGINVSRSPYFCTVDADSVLEENALIRLMAPVMESVTPVIACGGVIRVLNGTESRDGSIRSVRLPASGIAMFQIVEYLRAFLFGRVGLDAMNGILILSGAFSLFQKAAVVEAGGYGVKNVTEDLELILKLHKRNLETKTPYRIKFISDPVCWTEVPENLKMLGRQRRRWHLGLMQSLFQYRSAMFNSRYGKFGTVVLPYHLIIEMLSPLVEVGGYIAVILSYFLGMLSTEFLVLFLTLAILYGIFLSTASVFLEEVSYRRYPRRLHLFRLLAYGVFENLGYRQLNSFWRCQATLKYLVGMRKWEYVEKGKAAIPGDARA